MLAAPNVLGPSAAQVKSSYVVPVPVSCSELPTAPDPFWVTPMSVLDIPTAGPLVAVNEPSYDKNCTTTLDGSTRAIPSGDPFWRPRAATATTPNPSPRSTIEPAGRARVP